MKKEKDIRVNKEQNSFNKKIALIIAISILVVLSVTMLLICVISKTNNEQYVTRAEWITMLAENFGLTTYEQEEPYFPDIPDDHEIFDYVQASCEWDVLREGERFKPNKLANNSFVAETAVLAAMPIYDSSFKDMDSKELFLFAMENGIISSEDERDHLTEEECASIIEKAKKYYLSLVPEEYANIELKENVVDYSSSEDIQVDEDTVYFSENTGKELEVGTIFIAPGYPYGVAKKVTSVEQMDGQIVVKTEEPELDEVFEELDFCFVGRPSYEDIVPLQEGITICPISELDSSVNIAEESSLVNLSGKTSLLKDVHMEMAPFGVKINITKGKLTPNLDNTYVGLPKELNNILGQKMAEEATKIFKEANKVIKTDKNGKPYIDDRAEWKAGYEISGDLKVKDLYIEFSYEDDFKSFSSEINFTIESTLKLKGKLEGAIPIYKATVVGPWGVGCDIIFYVYVDANLELSVGVEIDHTSNLSYENKGFKSASETDCETKVKLSGNISAGFKGELIPTVLGIRIIDVSAKAGFGIEAGGTIHTSASESMLCLDIQLYYPVVHLEAGKNKTTVWNKLTGLDTTIKLCDKSGAGIKSKIKTLWHYEFTANGSSNVKKCTWGKFSVPSETESKHQSSETQHSAKTEATTAPPAPSQTEIETTTVTTGQTEPEITQNVDVGTLPESQGLEFTLSSDGKSYSVTGIGTCTDANVVVPMKYMELPVTSIGSYAFSDCASLTSITIPNSVTSIGFYAFLDCASLTSITIPNSVTNIAEGTFCRCTNLKSVSIPNSVIIIGNNLFNKCTSLKSILVESGNTVYHSSGNCIIETQSKILIQGCQTSVIPTDGSVTSIGRDAFSGCTSLTSIAIPNSVTSIGQNAFSYCTNLTIIAIPNSVTSIGRDAFSGCTSLTSVTIPNGITKIENAVFSDCSNLTSVTIPDGVTRIGSSAFYRCSNLTSIYIPDSVISIDVHAFEHCENLDAVYITDIAAWCKIQFERDNFYRKSSNPLYYAGNLYLNNKLVIELVIPNSVTKIGKDAFVNCSKITNVVIPNSVTSIGDSAFEDCSGLINVSIPDSVSTINYCAFAGCTSLASIELPNSITKIGTLAFSNCSSLKTVVIPDSVTGIGIRAFSHCDALISIAIPNSVTKIGDNAFEYCGALYNVYIPESITSLPHGVFSGCSALTNIHLPDTITELGSGVFSGCTNLTTIDLPKGITELGSGVFSGCTNLKSINIPNSVRRLGSRVFYECVSLTHVIIPQGVTYIDTDAFAKCTSLKSVYIPISVTSIDVDAFDDCNLLQDVYYEGSEAQWKNIEIIKDLYDSHFEIVFSSYIIRYNSKN